MENFGLFLFFFFCVVLIVGGLIGLIIWKKKQPKTTSGDAAAAATPQPVGLTFIGCFKDMPDRAVPTLEGTTPILDGLYRKRADPINKCRQAAMEKGYKVFTLQDNGWCGSSAVAEQTYNKYGPSTDCPSNGLGGAYINAVYRV